MNISLSNFLLDTINTREIKNVPDVYQMYFHLESGKEHYRLLIHLASCFNNVLIADIGTNYGASALALSQNQSTRVFSLDIVDLKKNDIGMQNVEFCLGDFRTDEKIQKTILSSDVIFLDIDHLYENEIWLYKFLKEKNWKGHMFCDDIHFFEGMVRFWNEVEAKTDLTKYGHGSGTGYIAFGEPITFDLL